ncbi:hypothetical protein PG988_014833 [Apiospora saccharicola]
MKTSAITRLLLVLLGAPELLQGRVIPGKGLEQRFVDLNPSSLNVRRRPSRGRGRGWCFPPRIGSGSSAGGGESSSGAQTGGQLGEFGTGQSSTGKRPLDSPTEPPAKIPNTGTADDALAGDASPDVPADPSGVTNIESRGYTAGKETSGDDLDIYEVKAGDDVIDNISIDKKQKIIFSDDLQNDLDTTPNRAKLWEVEMSLFVHQSGQAPSDLKGISYGGVSEANTKPTIDSVVARRGESFGIDRTSTVEQDQTDFQAFMDTKLGKSTQTLLRNSPVGKDITRIEVGPGSLEDLDLKFFF